VNGSPVGGNVLIVCTANQIRSPLAAAMLTEVLRRNRIEATISSAGTKAQDGATILVKTQAVAATYGLDLSGHRTRRLTTEAVLEADLVVAMAREHLRTVVALNPASFGYSFTLKDLVRRAERSPRRGGDLTRWIGGLSSGRSRNDLLGSFADDDVADPVNGPLGAYAVCATEIAELVNRLVGATWIRARRPPGKPL
jgi:protein-tyrosine phosphatase